MESNLEKEKQNTKIDDEPLFIEKDHKGLKVFLIITIILLILGGAGVFYYFKIYSNPMLVIGSLFKEFKEEMNFNEIDETETFKFNGEIDVDLGFEDASLQNIADIINDIKLQYILNSDGDDYTSLELFSKYKNESLLNGKMILDENYGYLHLDDLYDKYLQFDTEEIDESVEVDVNYEIVMNGLFNAVSKAVNEDDFERNEDKIDINGSIKKVYRNSLVINRDNYHRIMKTIITELRKDNDFINEVNKIYKKVDFKEQLNTILEEIDKETFEDIIKINFYTKHSLKQELLKIKIVHNSEDVDTTFLITSSSENQVTLDIFDNLDNKMTMDLKLNGDNNLIVNFNVNKGEDYIKMYLNCSFQELDKINKINTKPSIDINKLTEADQNKIITNLSENETLINLISDITNVFTPTM